MKTRLLILWFLSGAMGSQSQPFTCGVDSVADNHGNYYHTVWIGNRCWMKENMNATRNADGISVGMRKALPGDSHLDITLGPAQPFLVTVNGATVKALGLDGLPVGIGFTGDYRVPRLKSDTVFITDSSRNYFDSDWIDLETAAGMSPGQICGMFEYRGTVAHKFKTTGTEYWLYGDGTDELGFSAKGGGLYSCGMDFCDFLWLRETGWWWTYSDYFDYIMKRQIDEFQVGVWRGYYVENPSAFSVRCVKDE